MFLALTPNMNPNDSSNHIPGSNDHVTLNLAVDSLALHFGSGDKLAPAANTLKAASLAPVGQNKDSLSTPTHIGIIPPDSPPKTPLESVPSDQGEEPNTEVLPALDNAIHETVATTIPTDISSPATNLKRRLQNTKDLIVCPGVYDGFSARIALAVGCDAMYMVSIIRSACPGVKLFTSSRRVRVQQPLASASPIWDSPSSVTCAHMPT